MAVYIELKQAQNYQEDGCFGHRIALQAVVSNRNGARLHWLQRSDRASGPDMPAGTWVDLYRLAPQSPLFEAWQDSAGESGLVQAELPEVVSIRCEANAERVLDLWVVLIDGVDADGGSDGDWAVMQARQTLKCDAGGTIVEQFFLITGDEVGVDGDPPYPPGYSPPQDPDQS